MNDLLLQMAQKKATDLHLTVGVPPAFRVDGVMVSSGLERLTSETCQRLVYSLLSDVHKRRFEAKNELDVSFGIKGLGRVRMNVFRQRGSIGAALRSIPSRFMTFEELGLPPTIFEIMKLQRGLVLVTGPTGSGKSTTLASMVDHINDNRQCHIVTVEDPIEYLHFHKRSIVNQREIGNDTDSFGDALRHVLRQDPDVILVGEMRDTETIEAALTIAETGHIVFSTLHTNDAPSTINRILDAFPTQKQDQARVQLSMTLKAVICQTLVPHASGTGRVLACEVMIVTPAIQSLIRERKVEQVALAVQTGSKHGMQTMNQCLYDLYSRRAVTYQTALDHSTDVEDMKRLLPKMSASF